MTLEVRSTAFESGACIPVRYTGDGQDVSPPLCWTKLPNGTKSLALICDDPDVPAAEPWVHWVIFNVLPTVGGVLEGVPKVAEPKGIPEAVQGKNDFGKLGYGGPAPPRGRGTHRYRFRVYALDAMLKLSGTMTKEKLLEAMKGHSLESGELVGTYSR